MPGGRSGNVKNEKQYEALKDKGMSKERAADALHDLAEDRVRGAAVLVMDGRESQG